ncbi:MAG: hypothetical protein HYZ61_01545 [Candidatus Andersenbacteria bacterium]|nr:hypothetical protein [Candidatus Andersenbacteria bacterium]
MLITNWQEAVAFYVDARSLYASQQQPMGLVKETAQSLPAAAHGLLFLDHIHSFFVGSFLFLVHLVIGIHHVAMANARYWEIKSYQLYIGQWSDDLAEIDREEPAGYSVVNGLLQALSDQDVTRLQRSLEDLACYPDLECSFIRDIRQYGVPAVTLYLQTYVESTNERAT